MPMAEPQALPAATRVQAFRFGGGRNAVLHEPCRDAPFDAIVRRSPSVDLPASVAGDGNAAPAPIRRLASRGCMAQPFRPADHHRAAALVAAAATLRAWFQSVTGSPSGNSALHP
jgi:hypothetical protein